MGNPPNEVGEYRDGLYRRHVKKISTALTSYDVAPEESGVIFWYNTGTTMTVNLPKVSSNQLGLVFEFAIQECDSSNDFKLVCSKFDSSAVIQTAFSSIIDNHTTAIPASTFFTGARVTAVSSVVWMLEQITALAGAFSTGAADGVGGWSTG